MFIRLFLVLVLNLSLSAETNGSSNPLSNSENNGIAAVFERARAEGVLFRAIGNEPGWILEISSDKEVLFLTNLGQDRTHFEVIEKFSEYGATEYKMRSKHNFLLVRIEKRRCRDTMVDRVYESTVYINFDGVYMKGCGIGVTKKP